MAIGYNKTSKAIKEYYDTHGTINISYVVIEDEEGYTHIIPICSETGKAIGGVHRIVLQSGVDELNTIDMTISAYLHKRHRGKTALLKYLFKNNQK